ncbi:MAG: topoisomerase C-terminal repeat-containing protein, partial [Aphanizomenon sp.]
EPIYIKLGTYGPYIQLGDKSDENPKPKQASLLKGVTPETLTLEMAVGLLSLPRALGTHPETGGKVQASLGRFGPYVVHDQGKEGKDYRSLKSTDDVLTISLNRALELLAEPKKGRTASKSKSKEALRELGLHPEDDSPINIYDGPYGPYIEVTNGEEVITASIPKNLTPADLNPKQVEILLKQKTVGPDQLG